MVLANRFGKSMVLANRFGKSIRRIDSDRGRFAKSIRIWVLKCRFAKSIRIWVLKCQGAQDLLHHNNFLPTVVAEQQTKAHWWCDSITLHNYTKLKSCEFLCNVFTSSPNTQHHCLCSESICRIDLPDRLAEFDLPNRFAESICRINLPNRFAEPIGDRRQLI